MTAAAPTATSSLARDLELVERHRWGDADAFAEVYHQHATMVYNLALRLCGQPEDAADLTQDAFLRVFRHLGRFRGGSSLKTWIYRVALNSCRSRLSRRRLPTASIDEDEPGPQRSLPDPTRGPEERAVAGDEGRRVAAALAAIPPVFREAVVLRDLEGLTYDEIAEILAVPPGTVRSRIARGRDQLRTLLEAGR